VRVLIGAGLMLVLIAAAMMLASVLQRRRAQAPLSGEDREKVLAQVKTWVQGGPNAAAQGRT
jgi:hypothetical protein